MEIIFEFLVEVVLEGLIELMKSEKVPFFFRFIIYLICSTFLLGISGVLIWCALNEQAKMIALICLVLAIVVFILFISMTKEVFNKRSFI